MLAESNRLMTPNEVADRLAVNVGTLRVWRCTGRVDLPYVKIGNAVRYRPEAVEAYIEARTVGGPTTADLKLSTR